MCDWGGGPNSMANYVAPKEKMPEPVMKFIYRESVIQVLDGKEFTIVSSDDQINEGSVQSVVKRIANS